MDAPDGTDARPYAPPQGLAKVEPRLVVLAFVFLYVPSFVQPVPNTPVGALTDVLAQVGDEEITVGEFRQVYLLSLIHI